MPMLDHDYDYSTPMVKITNGDHPEGFVLMSESDVKDRAAQRAEAKKRGDDPDDVGPELVRYKEKPAAQKGQASPPGN